MTRKHNALLEAYKRIDAGQEPADVVEAIATDFERDARPRAAAPASTTSTDLEAKRRAWLARGVPEEPLDRVLRDRLLPTQGVRAAKRLQNAKWGLIVGAVGCGKSTAAVWWLTRFKAGLYRPALKLALLPVDGGRAPQWALRELEELERAAALVIDDVGWRDGGPDGCLAAAVQEVLYLRHEQGRPTLCTSNLAPRQMLKRARAQGMSWEHYLGDERLRDRWKHRGRCHAIQEDSLRGLTD